MYGTNRARARANELPPALYPFRMASEHTAVNDLERLEHSILPGDPPASADLLVEADRLPYDLAGPRLSAALVRLVERFGLPERPLVAAREEEGEDGDYQVLSGATWIRAAREAGMDRIPVRALELTDASAAFLALVLNQARPADVAAQADALQALLEAGADEQDLARLTGLGRGRLRRLVGLLELHPVLRQALREGQLGAAVAFAASGLSEASQQALADAYLREGQLSTADLRRAGDGGAGEAAAEPADGEDEQDPLAALEVLEGGAEPAEAAAARARRQAEELLRTLEEARITGEVRERVTEVIEELNRLALVP
jgi:ParB/RepB/Spo0J family partition protein